MTELDPPILSELLAFAHRLADVARGEILPRFRAEAGLVDKGGPGRFDPVTDADREAERAMRALIAAERPDDGVLGEEFPETPSKNGFSWTLDPVDGTRAFICGVPVWGTLIALAHDGVPMIGVIDQGFLDERYIGWNTGAEARIRGTTAPLRVRPCGALTEAVLAATAPDMFKGGEAGAFELVSRTARLTRFGMDCYAYAMLAAGRIDLVVESSLKAWDVQALYPVVIGAGGVAFGWDGAPAYRGGQMLAAGDARVAEAALVALSRATA